MNAEAFEVFSLADIYRNIAWTMVPTLLAFVVLVVLYIRRRLRGQVNPSDHVQSTRLGTVAGSLPAELSLLAGVGAGGQAHETLGEMFLRPTWGLRLITIGLPAFAAYLMMEMQAVHQLQRLPMDIALNGAMALVMLHVLIYTNTYELRYDRDRFAHRNWFYQRRAFDWSEIASIRHDNAYFYIIRTHKRRKTYVPKHLVGIEGLLETVQTHVAQNESR